MMSDLKAEDQNTQARLEHMAEEKPASELPEVVEPGQKIKSSSLGSDFKTRMAAIKAKVRPTPPVMQKPPVSVPEPQEAPVHAKVDEKPIITEEPKNVEKESEKLLTAEALFTEELAEKSMDRERFKSVFINTVQVECAGKTLDEIEESIRRDHEMLFDKRTGIQAKLAYRSELLKDATAEERAKRLKDDWLFKPNKKAAADNGEKPKKAAGPKKQSEKFDPAAAMRAALKAKGLSDDKIAERLAKFGL